MLVEAALVLPILLLVLFGIFEFGGAMLTVEGASHAVRAGSRTLSTAASDPFGDRDALRRIAKEASAMGSGEIDYVVIWHATGPGDDVPAGCVPGTPGVPNATSVGVSDGGSDAVGACNVYVAPQAPGGAFDMARDEAAQPSEYYFGCSGGTDPQASHKVDCRWPGLNRWSKTTPRSVNPARTPDFVGVHIQAEHTYYTGLIGDTLTVSDGSITQIEPQGYVFP